MEAGDWLAGADGRGPVETELITTTGLAAKTSKASKALCVKLREEIY